MYFFGINLFEFIGLKELSITHEYVIYGLVIYTLIVWFGYVIRMINELSDTLGIRVFVIPPQHKKVMDKPKKN